MFEKSWGSRMGLPRPRILGLGYIAIDVILNGEPIPRFSLGGSCGNVLSILSYFGWDSFPFVHLSNSWTSNFMYKLLLQSKMNTDFVFLDDYGSAPIVIEKLKQNSGRGPTHEFLFKCPLCNNPYPRRKKITYKVVETALSYINYSPEVVYFDRLSKSTLKLARQMRERGSLIFFEPMRFSDGPLFREAAKICHIIKYSSDQLDEIPIEMLSDEFYMEVKTEGNNGVSFRSNKTKHSWVHVKEIPLQYVKDTAGAGDWLSALIIHHLGFEASAFIEDFNKEEISNVLSVSQCFSALNCLYEGARGIMEVYSRADLFELVAGLINNLTLELDVQPSPPHSNEDLLKSLCDYCRADESILAMVER
jgi:fructokinase